MNINPLKLSKHLLVFTSVLGLGTLSISPALADNQTDSMDSDTDTEMPVGGMDSDTEAQMPAGEMDSDTEAQMPAGEMDSDTEAQMPAGEMDSDTDTEMPAGEMDSDTDTEMPAGEMDSDTDTEVMPGGMDSDTDTEIPTGGMDSDTDTEIPTGGIDSDTDTEIPTGGMDSDTDTEMPAGEMDSDTDTEMPMNESSAETGNIVEVASGDETFSTLVQAVEAAGLADTLSDSSSSYTVFAPTNEAFNQLPAGTLDYLLQPENQEVLQEVLSYHVLPERVTASEITGGEIESLDGGLVTEVTDEGVVINNASVITPDIEASNGVIHGINRVLLPADLQRTLASELGIEETELYQQ